MSKKLSLLERVKKLRPVQFRYNSDVDESTKLRAGFIAQEVQEIFPECVFEHNGRLAIKNELLGSYINQAQDEYIKNRILNNELSETG